MRLNAFEISNILTSSKTAHSLSPPQRPLCIVERLEKREKKAHGGQWEGEREEARFFPLPIVPRALSMIFRLLLFYTQREPLRKLNVLGAQPLLKGRVTPFFRGNKQLNKPNRQSKEKGSAKKTILKN